MKRKIKAKTSDSKPITMGDLGIFTEEVILSGVERVVQEVRNDVRDTRKELADHIIKLGERADKLDELIENMHKHNMAVLQSNDKIVTKLDTLLKDQAAHNSLHQRITDDIARHEKLFKELEEAKS